MTGQSPEQAKIRELQDRVERLSGALDQAQALERHAREGWKQDIDELEVRLHTMLNTVMPETRNEDVPSRLRRLIMVHARLYALAAREQS